MILMCYATYFFFDLVESSNVNFKVIKCELCNKTQGVIKLREQTFLELFTIREKNVCKAAQKYLGEFWYDIVAHTGHPDPRACPRLPGRYHTDHMELNFNKLTLQTFPFGRLRFIMRLINNKNPYIDMGCLLVEVENIIN